VDYVDGFPYIEPFPYPWDVAYLIMMDDHFDVFMHLVCKNSIEYFCIDIHKGNCSEVLFVVGSLCGLGISIIVASYKELGSAPSVSSLWNSLDSIGMRFSMSV